MSIGEKLRRSRNLIMPKQTRSHKSNLASEQIRRDGKSTRLCPARRWLRIESSWGTSWHRTSPGWGRFARERCLLKTLYFPRRYQHPNVSGCEECPMLESSTGCDCSVPSRTKQLISTRFWIASKLYRNREDCDENWRRKICSSFVFRANRKASNIMSSLGEGRERGTHE